MSINSAFRTVAQQYLLYAWYKQGRCGIGLAATPGNSNHEQGLAVDIEDMQFFDTQTDLAIRDLPRRTTISQEDDDGNNFRDLNCRPGPGTRTPDIGRSFMQGSGAI